MLKLPLIFFGLFTSALATPLLVSLEPPDINALAKDSTVRVNGQSPGSGVIFKKQGDTYYVLTAKHVVETPDEYEIVTPDEQVYPLDYAKIYPMANTDLAVTEFNSEQAYA
ncbi:MAG: trypsin-like peptidase domain-containing protein, partial [Cyanobacteria bacterium P01_D01_bin.2]